MEIVYISFISSNLFLCIQRGTKHTGLYVGAYVLNYLTSSGYNIALAQKLYLKQKKTSFKQIIKIYS